MRTLSISPSSAPVVAGVATLYPTGADIAKNATAEAILGCAQQVTTYQNAVSFWVADIVAAARNLPDEPAQLTLDALGLSYADTVRAVAVASIPRADRDGRISAVHHAIIAHKLSDSAERRRWIKIAADEGLSIKELAESIDAGEIRRTLTARGAQIYSASSVVWSFQKWTRQIGEKDPSKWSQTERLCAMQELAPISEFITALRGAIGQENIDFDQP